MVLCGHGLVLYKMIVGVVTSRVIECKDQPNSCLLLSCVFFFFASLHRTIPNAPHEKPGCEAYLNMLDLSDPFFATD